MITKIMPIMDLVSAVVILFAAILPGNILYYIGGYLLFKGGLFVLVSKDVASMFDVAIGVYVLLIIAGAYHVLINSAASFFLAQKGLLGMLAF